MNERIYYRVSEVFIGYFMHPGQSVNYSQMTEFFRADILPFWIVTIEALD